MRAVLLPISLFLTIFIGFFPGAAGAGTPAVTEHPDDYRWSEGFGLPGMDFYVSCAASGSNGLYAGGWFEVAGRAAANRIAHWDGAQWNPLGSGLDVYPNAIDVEGFDVYVGGGFHDAGGVPAEHIAKWNGSSWSALGPGVNGQVYAVEAVGGVVYAGGSFHLAGSTPVANLGMWDGVDWTEIGGGTNGTVRALLFHEGCLYVGGQFTVAGVDSINGIACWDGENWTQLGDGLDGVIYDIVTDGTDIYTANVVTSVYGTVIESWVQKWDGVSWTVVGLHLPDLSDKFDGYITDLAFAGGTLYVGGDVWEDVDLWKLSGGLWVGITVEGCLELASYDGNLVIGGDFRDLGSVRANYIGLFDGTWFYPIAGSPNYGFGGAVHGIAIDGTDMYVGGTFTHIGTQAFSRIARWDGTQWNSLGGGVDFEVVAVAVHGSDVYAGGHIHGGPQQWQAKISRWNGSSWQDLAGSVSGEVDAIEVWNGDVYVSGRFTMLGGVTLNGIGRWDGAWHDVAGGMSGDLGSVFCLEAGDDALYAGGRFEYAGGVAALRIAKWNGVSWAPLGDGLILHPFTISVDGNKVYAGGVLNTAGGIAVNGVAMWDGTQWHALGDGVILSPYSSIVIDHHVYFGGNFVDAGGQDINYLAKWDGFSWYPLGSGVRGNANRVTALATDGDYLYAGGEFVIAGEKASVSFAKWDLTDPVVPALIQNFAAMPGAGRVELSWAVVENPDIVGFWINRENARTGKLTVVNETMILPGTSSHTDRGVVPGETYRYWLDVVKQNGAVRSAASQVTVASCGLSLDQNYPNPFNPATTITFSTGELQPVKLDVFDAKGRLVTTLLDEIKPPGVYRTNWNGTNSRGQRVATGVYFVRLQAGAETLTRKVSLVK